MSNERDANRHRRRRGRRRREPGREAPADLELTRCPVCRARLAGRDPQVDPCRRCGSDLSLVHACYLLAAHHRQAARQALRAAPRPLDPTLRSVSTNEARSHAREALSHARAAVRLVDCQATRHTLAAALLHAHHPHAALTLLQPKEGDGVR